MEDGELRGFRLSSLAFRRSGNTCEEFGGKESGFVATGAGADFHD